MGKTRPGREPEVGTPKGSDPLPGASDSNPREGRAFVRGYLLRSLEVFMYWMPVWVPLILLAQIGTRGLQPALDEEQRLVEHERVLLERLEADEARARKLTGWHKAIDDEIYRERLRRLGRDEVRRQLEERDLGARESQESPGSVPAEAGEPEAESD